MNNFGSGKAGINKKGKIDVFVNDQTNALFHYFLINEQKTDILLTADAPKNSEKINVSPGHGFTASPGEYIVMFYNNRFVQQEVKAVDGDEITIFYPISSGYPMSDTIIYRGNIYLNIDASVSPVNFLMTLKNFTIPVDISIIKLTMSHTSSGDDGKFGGISELSNGLWFRKENGDDFNLGNYRKNQDFKNNGAAVQYTSKGPGGSESTSIEFDLKKIFGQVIRMDARINDIIRGQSRDNLSGLANLTISIIGSYTDEP